MLEREQVVARPLADVFAFFADARNLETLTRPWFRFEILRRGPIGMAQRAGCVIGRECPPALGDLAMARRAALARHAQARRREPSS